MTITAVDMADIILQADTSSRPYRLEYVRGRIKVELSPASRHQMTAKEIEQSIKPLHTGSRDCACYSLQDVLIRFPDAEKSIKRPDIAIFCTKPPASDTAIEVLPAAVVEIISLNYEEKDLGDDGAPFYLACGIADVVVVDPRSGMIRHYRADGMSELHTPDVIALTCGCEITV